ncbi:MAG: LysM peptidoglycan-binding domain-containing protein, partial [Pseudomonadota bacterium]|nr:LysM peptidoglycan-binding domain-containing protein [Pseudomonadota bacterium]
SDRRTAITPEELAYLTDLAQKAATAVINSKAFDETGVKPPKSLLSSPNQSVYTVRSGDTLYSIANRYNVQVAELKQWNQLSSNELSVGTVLQLTPTTTHSRRLVSKNCHTVQKGETLYRIAQRYGYPLADIAQWNHLQWPYTLNVGQTLKVSPRATHCS